MVVLGGFNLARIAGGIDGIWKKQERGKNVVLIPLFLLDIPLIRHLLLSIQQFLMGVMVLKGEKIDLLYCPTPMSPPAVLLKKLFHLPLMVKVQGDSAFKLYRVKGKRLSAFLNMASERLTLRAADVVLPMSSFTAQYAIRHGADPKRTSIQPFKILDLNWMAAADGRAIRTHYGIALDAPIVLCIARLSSEKGLEYLIRASSAVADQIPNMRLVIVGDGPLREGLVSLVRSLNLSEKVFFAGKVGHREVWNYIASCNLLVLPSIWPEGLGMVLVEAMLMGKPVIGSDIGGIKDVIKEGINGYLVPPKDIDKLALRISELLSNQRLAKNFGENGKNIAQAYIRSFRTIDEILAEANRRLKTRL